MVRWINAQNEVGLVELYDHAKDPGENVNVAESYPDIVARLTQELRVKMAEVVLSSHQR